MEIDGFALIQNSDDTIVVQWSAVPERLNLPNGDVVYGANVKWKHDKYRIVKHRYTTPDPPAARIPKSIIIARLTNQQLDDALTAMTTRQKEHWHASDLPTIAVDDPWLLQLLDSIGADPKIVLAPV